MKNLSVYLPEAITKRAGRQILLTKKHSPTILFAAGVVGFVATTIAASRATLKLDEVLTKAEVNLKTATDLALQNRPDYTPEDCKKDKLYIYVQSTVDIVKIYTPAFLLGAASIAALTKSHNILSNRNASLMAAYAALDSSFKKYRERNIALHTDEDGNNENALMLDDACKYDTEVVKVEDKDGVKQKTHRIAGVEYSQYARFFDQLCPDWSPTPEYNRIFLQCAQNYANDLLRSRGHVFLNEVYDMLKLERSQAGAVVGWVFRKDGKGDNIIDFGIFNRNSPAARDFVNGREGAILLDFNVDGVIFDQI